MELAENPMSVDLCTALLADAFPDVDDRRILADVEKLFSEMSAAGLVEPVERERADRFDAPAG